MDRLPGDVELLPRGRGEDLLAELYACAWVDGDSELIAAVVVLARERTARLDGDDLDCAGEVVRVLLEPAPWLLYS